MPDRHVLQTKVDVELAMSALDKIMRANELTFHLLSAVPTALFARYLLGQALSLLSSRASLVGFASQASMGAVLHELSACVNQMALLDAHDLPAVLEREGQVFVLAHRLQGLVRGGPECNAPLTTGSATSRRSWAPRHARAWGWT